MYSETVLFALDAASAQTSNGSKRSATYHDIPDMIEQRRHCTQVKLAVERFTCTNTFYVINEHNDYVEIGVPDDAEYDFAFSFRVPHGNYTAASFIAMALEKLGPTWNISVSEITGKLTFGYKTWFVFTSNTTCMRVLGGEMGKAYRSDGLLLEMPFPCNFLGADTIFVRAGNLPCQHMDARGEPFLITVAITSSPYEQVYYTRGRGEESCSLSPQASLSGVSLEFEDEYGNVLDFCGQNWSMVLSVTYVMEQPPDAGVMLLSQLIAQYMTLSAQPPLPTEPEPMAVDPATSWVLQQSNEANGIPEGKRQRTEDTTTTN